MVENVINKGPGQLLGLVWAVIVCICFVGWWSVAELEDLLRRVFGNKFGTIFSSSP